MTRSLAVSLLALVLAVYGIYTALYIPAMLVGPAVPLLLIGFLAQVVFALAAAAGLWGGRSWAAIAVILLGVSIAATQVFEIFLGIVPFARAVLIAVVAIVGALLLAATIRSRPIAT